MLRGPPRLAITLPLRRRLRPTLSDGAGGVLPGLPSGCSGIGDQD
jgi:hypothetical protein